MAGNSDSQENIDSSSMIDRLLDASKSLIVSIKNLEDLVERKRCSFQVFSEEKLLSHHAEMEDFLDGLREEIHILNSWVVVLEVSSSTIARVNHGGIGVGAPVEHKMTHSQRGTEEGGRGS